LAYGSWILTAAGIYYQELVCLTLVFGINVAFGCCTLIFHCLPHVKFSRNLFIYVQIIAFCFFPAFMVVEKGDS